MRLKRLLNALLKVLFVTVTARGHADVIAIGTLSSDNSTTIVKVGEVNYWCTMAENSGKKGKPPVSNGWTFETFDCDKVASDSGRVLRSLAPHYCSKCHRECGGQVPTPFPDPFCRRCIPECYYDYESQR